MVEFTITRLKDMVVEYVVIWNISNNTILYSMFDNVMEEYEMYIRMDDITYGEMGNRFLWNTLNHLHESSETERMQFLKELKPITQKIYITIMQKKKFQELLQKSNYKCSEMEL